MLFYFVDIHIIFNFFAVVNNESTSMVVSRQFVADIATHLNQPSLSTVLVKSVGESVLCQLQVSFFLILKNVWCLKPYSLGFGF